MWAARHITLINVIIIIIVTMKYTRAARQTALIPKHKVLHIQTAFGGQAIVMQIL